MGNFRVKPPTKSKRPPKPATQKRRGEQMGYEERPTAKPPSFDDYEIAKKKQTPHLKIILDEVDSVPRVFYKGKEINLKQEVLFHWETDTDIPGGTTIEIEFAQEGCGYPKSKKVAERLKSHMKY